MNTKIFIPILITILALGTVKAQNQEASDSIISELQEVVVTAKQPATELVGATLVSTIPGSNLADLGNVFDVLAQLPMINVNDDVVSVIGKSNIEIYIDGRPAHDSQELQQILSSSLKTVELDMSPGAVYASNTEAVIRITTKRKFVQGFSFTNQFQLQRRRKWSVMNYIDLNYRLGSWEIFVSGAANSSNTLAIGTTINTLLYDGRETVVGSSQQNSYLTANGVVKTGFNYTRGAQSFGAFYRYNPEQGDFNNTGAEWLDDNPGIYREIYRHIRARSHHMSVYYENRFADKYLIHFDGDFHHSPAYNRVATIYTESTIPEVNSTDERISTLWAGKFSLTLPLFSGQLIVGTHGTHTHTSLNYRMLNSQVGEYIPSSFTDTRQTSAVLFASWSRMFGKFSISAGARYEYVDYDFKVDGKHDEAVSRKDHLLTPDISMGYSINKESRISFSYKMKTVKPPYSQLTGALNYVGMHEIEGGNMALHDERMHDMQLLGLWKGVMIQANFSRSLDSYAFVKQVYQANNLQLLMHPVNIDVSALSLYLAWSGPVGRWTPSITAGIYRQWLDLDGTDYNKPIFSYYFDNTFSLPRGWMITVNVSGRTQGDMHTNRFGTTVFAMDASVGKSFFNKSFVVNLSATDMFNTANNDWTMNTYGVSVDKRQRYDHRGISLNVIYNFHPYKSKYRGSSAASAEMQRL